MKSALVQCVAKIVDGGRADYVGPGTVVVSAGIVSYVVNIAGSILGINAAFGALSGHEHIAEGDAVAFAEVMVDLHHVEIGGAGGNFVSAEVIGSCEVAG